MTPDEKVVVLSSFYDAWMQQPEQRLGQLIVNALNWTGMFNDRQFVNLLFYIEDKKLYQQLLDGAAKMSATEGEV